MESPVCRVLQQLGQKLMASSSKYIASWHRPLAMRISASLISAGAPSGELPARMRTAALCWQDLARPSSVRGRYWQDHCFSLCSRLSCQEPMMHRCLAILCDCVVSLVAGLQGILWSRAQAIARVSGQAHSFQCNTNSGLHSTF